MTADERLDTAKMLLGLTGTDKDAVLKYLLDDAESMILSYCRIEFLPRPLESVIPSIAADMYRASGYGTEDAPKDIQTLSEGSRSVSYKSNRPNRETILKNYYQRIKPFKNRKGRVPSECDCV